MVKVEQMTKEFRVNSVELDRVNYPHLTYGKAPTIGLCNNAIAITYVSLKNRDITILMAFF